MSRRAGRRQQGRKGGSNRLASGKFDIKELTGRIDLKENVLPLRGNPHVDGAVLQGHRLHERVQPGRYIFGEGVGHLGCAQIEADIVGVAVRGRLSRGSK